MSPNLALPIRMDGLLCITPLHSVFIREDTYNKKAAIVMDIPRNIVVLIEALVFKSLPLDLLKWVVLVVTLYTSGVMLRAELVPMEMSRNWEEK
ncbi:hypothetical protein [Algoriphagus halophilus]|uniref:hypothetical protein n=1 Tax=Algoriphagus halophilus TaxID=226505 RepID=UPI0009415295|nr:hypothetical protein [Algoriphagus halophilus]